MHSRLKIEVKLTANLLNALKNDTSITRMTDARLPEEDKVLLVPAEKNTVLATLQVLLKWTLLKIASCAMGSTQ